jgi:hypothetical protein
MLKERLNLLKSKDYNVTKISITTIFSDPKSTYGLLYFSKPIYIENMGFSNTYTPTRVLTEEPSAHINKVETRLDIEFSIGREKINSLKTVLEPKPLLKKITNEIMDLLNINCQERNYYINAGSSEAILHIQKHSKKDRIIIRIYVGTLNFHHELKNNPNALIKGEIRIIKEKDIYNYF